MGTHLDQETSSIEAELQLKLLDDDHHVQKGGLRTMPFIIVNEAFESIASYGLLANMIFYLMEVYHMEAATGTIVLSIWTALSNGLSVVGGVVSDAYLGRFRVIATGSLFSLVGVTFLWLTSIVQQLTPSSCQEPDTGCSPPTRAQLGFLYASFGLMSIGSACIKPCSLAFGADQLKHRNNQRLIDSYFNWFLNKACVRIGSSGSNLCGVPTVEDVESLKSLIRIIPLWSSGILIFVNIMQGFPALEAKKMNRHITSNFEIPAASFGLFMLLAIIIWIPFYDRVFVPFLAKFTHEPRGLKTKTLMGVGIILSIIIFIEFAQLFVLLDLLSCSSELIFVGK